MVVKIFTATIPVKGEPAIAGGYDLNTISSAVYAFKIQKGCLESIHLQTLEVGDELCLVIIP
uniref:Uncharacterized protein n=1 Tax=Dulem virus 171 TaxID=3145648 RepID=A0AAU8AZF0_9VIRU